MMMAPRTRVGRLWNKGVKKSNTAPMIRALMIRERPVLAPALSFTADLEKLPDTRSEEHTSELQSRPHLVCRLLLEKKKKYITEDPPYSREATGPMVSTLRQSYPDNTTIPAITVQTPYLQCQHHSMTYRMLLIP